MIVAHSPRIASIATLAAMMAVPVPALQFLIFSGVIVGVSSSCDWLANASHVECDMDLGCRPAVPDAASCDAKCAAWQYPTASDTHKAGPQ